MRQRHDGLYKRCDCDRRQWAKCRHTWHLAFKWNGTHHRFSLDRHLGRRIDSKTEAESEAENIRTAIRAGTFGQPAPRAEMTLRQLADTYLERYVLVERKDTADDFRSGLRVISNTVLPCPTGGTRAFGEWRLTDIVTDTVERYREARRSNGTGLGGSNRSLSRLRALFNWAVRVGYMDGTPFKRHTATVVNLPREINRTRRLQPGEEEALLSVCGPHLRAVVECALEAAMRRGEILSLQWSQVEGMRVLDGRVSWAPKPALFLSAAKTKTKRDRRIPISSRLRAILEMRRFDPASAPMPLEGYVFGTEIGTRVKDTKRAWTTAVLKSHGHQPTYTKTQNFDTASRAALAALDLQFRDLRRECASRWLEGGVRLHVIRDWLGHTSIAQTSTYLGVTLKTAHDAMEEYEIRRRVQQCATDSETGGRKSPRTATPAEKTPNKTGNDRDSTIM